ncbi:MAG: hypothetical protein WCB04_00345, partial [Mycobacteriales bacterium]
YLLVGHLSGDRPGPAPVYRFTTQRATAADVMQLAGALRMPGSPSRTAQGWQVVDGQRILNVADGPSLAWQIGPGVVASDTSVQCVRAPCPGWLPIPPKTGPAPSPAQAQRVAATALRAMGLPANHLRTTPNGQWTDVQAPRPVGGQTASGFATALSVGGDGEFYGGHGWLGRLERSASYPLVSAAEAFRRLQAQPQPELLLCRMQPNGSCAPALQVRVTGARLGIMMAADSDRPTLVPAWLFAVAGQTEPIAVVAVQSRFLAPWLPGPIGSTGSGAVGGGSAGSAGTSVAPAQPAPKPK